MYRLVNSVLLIVIAVTCLVAQEPSYDKRELSDAEKTKMVKHVFDTVFLELFEHDMFLGCLTPVVKVQKIILVETDLGEAMLPTDIEGFRFMKITHSELRKELLSNKGGCYFKLQDPRSYKDGIRVFLTRYKRGILQIKDSEKLSEWFTARSSFLDFEMVKNEWTEKNRGHMIMQN